MDFTNKRAIFLGDSITEGYLINNPKDTYVELVAKGLGLKAYINAGLNGTRIARNPGASDYHKHDLYFALRASILPGDNDLIIIFGGTNDFGFGEAKMGYYFSKDDYTFMGAYNNLIKMLKERNENAQIVLLTPLHRADESFLNNNGYALRDYSDAIKEISKYNSLKVIDLFNELSLNPNDNKYFYDGLHPTELGHKILSEFLLEKIKAL